MIEIIKNLVLDTKVGLEVGLDWETVWLKQE